jgi:hypothetical protein
MSLPAGDTPRPFQPPVAQRHIKAEVAHCVGGVLSPLLANIALSVLDDHFARAQREQASVAARQRRRRHGLANYRLVRYADLCRARHKSAYAEDRIMPTSVVDCLPGREPAVRRSA